MNRAKHYQALTKEHDDIADQFEKIAGRIRMLRNLKDYDMKVELYALWNCVVDAQEQLDGLITGDWELENKLS